MASLAKRIQAARVAVKAFWGSGNWVDSSAPGNVYSSSRRSHWVPGTVINWDVATGDLWACPAVQACLNWINRNFTQADAMVRQKVKDGRWEAVPDHPLIDAAGAVVEAPFPELAPPA